ncbi:MAG: anti-sigma factor [Rhodospirillales bacterium]|nr:anti-sigma factor [Rhodospirillales bacterium]MDH3965911.1 anti-sigma factor [Rhodospirillales bacterium]
MTAGPQEISEQDLQAYVDGWLDPARLAAVEAYLAEHPDEAARLAAYRRQNEALRGAFAEPRGEDVPERLLLAARRRSPGRPLAWLARAAAALALVAVGFGAGWGLRGGLETSGLARGDGAFLVQQAAAAHRVFSVEVRHPVEVRAEEAHLVAWLSKRVGVPLKAPDLSGHGFRLVGGRLLPAAEGTAAQLMYEDEAGRRVTAYMTANTSGGETAFRFAEDRGLAAFYWLEGPLGYALVGALTRAELIALAKSVYRQLEL